MLTAEIDLKTIKNNALYIKKSVKTDVYAVVKADAYGHGAVPVAKYIANVVDGFAVATDFEALELAESGIGKNILILGPELSGTKLPENIIPSISAVEDVRRIKGMTRKVHISINTGMNRFGCDPRDLYRIMNVANDCEVEVRGVFTHFYNEQDKSACSEQFNKFLSCVLPVRDRIKRLHCCASNCLILPEVYRLDAVRPGLAMYGYGYDGVQPAMTIYSNVLQLNDVRKGEHIGYGSFTADKNMRIATVRLGYGDGLWRRNGHRLIVNGKYCPVVGMVCMDVCMIDVSDVQCKVGDKAFLLADSLQMNDICITHNTIPHEVLTMISRRIKRKYVKR